MFDQLDWPKRGRLLDIEGLGAVIEILPFVFCPLKDFDTSTQAQSLIFLRTARVKDPRRSGHFEQQPANPRVASQVFTRAIEILEQGLSINQDLAPEMAATGSPLAMAALIGAAVHANQLDKLGFPYIEHPRRVFINSHHALAPEAFSSEERFSGLQAAWLHDVLEDSQESFYRRVDSGDLENWGLSARVISLIELLTRSDSDQNSGAYYERILKDKTARAVKLADIADNLAKWRTDLLDEATSGRLTEKYVHAVRRLGYDSAKDVWFQGRVDSSNQDSWPLFACAESHEALRLAKTTRAEKTWFELNSRSEDFWKVVSEIETSSSIILRDSAWVAREGERSTETALTPFSLEAWYGALLLLHTKAQSKGDQELLKHAQSLGDFLDSIGRGEAELYKHWRIVPRDINYLQVKLRFVAALAGLHALQNASPEDHLWGVRLGEPPLSEMSEGQLLDMAAMSFSESSLRWIFDAMKTCLSEVNQRIGK